MLLRTYLLSSVFCVSFTTAGCLAQAADPPTPAAPAPASAAAKPAPAWASDPKFLDAVRQAKELEKKHEPAYAADAYKKANKVAGGQCTECLQAMYRTEMFYREYKDALASATSLQALYTTPAMISYVGLERAQAMLAQAGDKPKPAQLQAVDAVLKQAIETYSNNGAARFAEGEVLARLGKLAEASVQFTECVKCAKPNDPSRLRAQHFAENPSLALNKMAPAFEVSALDGSKFNLDAMNGHVVLIDFWATWCGPCNAELPHMKKIAKEFAGQPLVILSVSWDSDEEAWKSFIAKNEITWKQYRDTDHKLSREFDVSSIPHYFTIDTDGVLTAEMVGSGSNVEGRLKKLLAKARETQPAVAGVVVPEPSGRAVVSVPGAEEAQR